MPPAVLCHGLREGVSLQTTCKNIVCSREMGDGTSHTGQRCPGAFNSSCRALAPWVGQISGGSKSWGKAASEGIVGHSLTEICELREPLGNACGHRGGLGLSHAGAGLCDPCGSLPGQDALRMLSVAPSVPEVTQLGGLSAPAGPAVTRQRWGGDGVLRALCHLCWPRGDRAGQGRCPGWAVPGAGASAGKAAGDFWVTCWWSLALRENGK